MDEFLGLVKGFSPQVLVCLGVMVWYFSWCLKKERLRLEQMISTQVDRIDKVYELMLQIFEKQKAVQKGR